MLSCLATFWMVGNVTVAGMICNINSFSWTTWNIKFLLLLRLRYFNLMFLILIIVVAWAVIPREIGITTGPFLYNSWRIFVFLCGTPAFLVAISLFGFPESPQFLALHGKPEFALKVISKIYAANKGLHYTSFPVIINTK